MERALIGVVADGPWAQPCGLPDNQRSPGKQALRACAHSTRSKYTFSITFPNIDVLLRFTGHQGVDNRIYEMLIALMISLVNRT